MIATTSEASCRDCKKPFQRRSTLQSTCIPCVLKVANAKDRATAKAQRQAAIDERVKFRARKDAVKRRSDWMAEAQQAFNAWTRARDAAAGLACVSCGRHHAGQIHAGHYLSVGARPELRFCEANVWAQCQPCNTHLHGNLVLYRVELVKRIGLEAVEALEGPHPPAKWSVDDLKAIKATYRAKARALQVSQPA